MKSFINNVDAIVLSYYDYNFEVFNLMQKVSHSTRAVFRNPESGLKRFLIPGAIEVLYNSNIVNEEHVATDFNNMDVKECVVWEINEYETE